MQTAIDRTHQRRFATIPLGGGPSFPRPIGRGMVYDNVESTSEIRRHRRAQREDYCALSTGKLPASVGSLKSTNTTVVSSTACTGEMGVVDARFR